ncbi:MAG: transcription termination factor NusA [Candidatus Latescibacterota bacterium]|nr:MAG: transcription termination factor NusA [Candidatus Latescibacterota bacterium]
MNVQFAEAFNNLIREKRIDKALLMETLAAGFSSAVKKKFGSAAEIEIEEDSNGNIALYLVKNVVEEVEDPSIELTLDQAQELDEEAELGGAVKIHLPFNEFGRNAIQIAKQILMQKIREFERERTFEEYKNRVGEIVSGSVQQIDRSGILVNLGNAEATMPKKEQIRRERYNQGASIRSCIIDVDKEAKGPMVVLSRTSPEFLKKLFAQEVPEIYEGIIEIKSVAREAGGRSKIAVYSRDDRVDAVGACVGMKGSRVQAVVNELSGERIDIVPWSDDIRAFVSRALSPAKIASVRVDLEAHGVLVVVEEDQLSLAIGKDGQNVRLASKLTGWQIDLTTTRELEQRERLEEHLTMSIEEMVGVTARIAETLKGEGINTVQKLAKTSDDDLLALPGLGPKTVAKLKETAEGTIQELEKALRELMDKENEERARAKEEEKPLFDDDTTTAEEEQPAARKDLTEETLFSDTEPDDTETGSTEHEEDQDSGADTSPAQDEEATIKDVEDDADAAGETEESAEATSDEETEITVDTEDEPEKKEVKPE